MTEVSAFESALMRADGVPKRVEFLDDAWRIPLLAHSQRRLFDRMGVHLANQGAYRDFVVEPMLRKLSK